MSANELGTGKAQPVKASQRIVVLDALRGFALMGIALANYPEFTLWTFLSETEQAEMPSANIDNIVHWLQCLLVDGKFYTIFFILFGIGFSIIITHAMQRQSNGFSIFFRRMTILLLIGSELISLIVFSIETLLCSCWLRFFNFGPLEWLWRMLTYRKWFPLVKHTQASEKTASEQ